MSDEETRGFTIVDKRGSGAEAEPDPATGVGPSEASAGQASEPALPGVDFTSFVLSLATSALYHLGLVPDPDTGQKATPNLPIARQTVDTIAMLQDKTRGNLSDEEAELVTNLLTDLRMRCVEAG